MVGCRPMRVANASNTVCNSEFEHLSFSRLLRQVDMSAGKFGVVSSRTKLVWSQVSMNILVKVIMARFLVVGGSFFFSIARRCFTQGLDLLKISTPPAS